MFVALWEFDVKPGCQERFEKVYGPAGDWAKLFCRDSNYRETRLLNHPFHPAIYLILDFWTSRQAYEEFLASHGTEYKQIDDASNGLTMKERRIGWYELVAPRPKLIIRESLPQLCFPSHI